MKNDARTLLNIKRLKKQPSVAKMAHGVMDARKILNQKKRLNKRGFQGLQAASSTRNKFQTFQRVVPMKTVSLAKSPEKHVKLSRDGNILITARAKESTVTSRDAFPASAPLATKIRDVPQWTPANVDSVNLEHVNIDDVLDMDSLPSAPVGLSSRPRRETAYQRSLAEEIVDMQNTMVADQVASSQPPSLLVSNLHSSVTRQDILELFGDVGLIKQAEMVQPGVACIEFFELNDAAKACDLYHNRLLDGQPMKCVIQPPSTKRPLISQRLGERVQTVAPISRFPSSTNSRSIYNPRNVQFTVKLT